MGQLPRCGYACGVVGLVRARPPFPTPTLNDIYNRQVADAIFRHATYVANASEDVFGTPVSKAARHVRSWEKLAQLRTHGNRELSHKKGTLSAYTLLNYVSC